MVAIPFPLSSAPSGRPGESRGRLVNVCAQKRGDDVIYPRVPGLAHFADIGASTPRGFLEANGTVYSAFADIAVTISASGSVAPLTGPLSGTLPVTWARNNVVPVPDIVAVTENGGFSVAGGVVSAYPDGDVNQPNSVCSLDGYFLFTYGDGTIVASDLNSLNINSLSNAKAESDPDGLLRGMVSGSIFYAFGPNSIEAWQDAGTQPFPLSRAHVLNLGLIGPWAVAGGQGGWSEGLYFVASDRTVRSLKGFDQAVISIGPVERALAKVADASTIRAMVYVAGELKIVSISAPGFTWEYNVTTQQWHERMSFGAAQWRADQSVWAFGKWLVGDTKSQTLFQVHEDAQQEGPDPIVWTVESLPVKQFPSQMVVGQADFDFVTGQAPGPTQPEVSVSWSDDGGATWTTPLLRGLGGQGAYRTLVRVNQCGRSSHTGRIWRLSGSDAVYSALLGGDMGRTGARRA
jgi:hypothetical protein